MFQNSVSNWSCDRMFNFRLCSSCLLLPDPTQKHHGVLTRHTLDVHFRYCSLETRSATKKEGKNFSSDLKSNLSFTLFLLRLQFKMSGFPTQRHMNIKIWFYSLLSKCFTWIIVIIMHWFNVTSIPILFVFATTFRLLLLQLRILGRRLETSSP